jgi:UDP-N-acetylmuramoylalanine--D-glutamate ligase
MEFDGRRYTILGLGRHGGGVAAARWLAAGGAQVTVTDRADAAALAESIAALVDAPISGWTLGRHDERDLLSADAIVVNPAVRPDHPLLALARAGGVTITSEIELFLERCPAPIVAVTGSNGKSTTATMLAGICSAAGETTWLGGNIGVSLLPKLGTICASDRVVLELSSFQLAHLSPRSPFPSAAVVTNCTPNHLDWHGTFAEYAAAKRRLVENLPAHGFAVLNISDAEVASWATHSPPRVVTPWPLECVPPLAVAGQHNRANAGYAAAAAEALEIPRAAIERGLQSFTGLAHRCQPAGEVAGRQFMDDSKSTTPEATLAALAAASGRVWLLLGGLDKGADFEPLLAAVARRSAGAACYGACGADLHRALVRQAPGLPCDALADLTEAFRWCWQRSSAGDTILLSPACASLDQFRDFEHRADVFRGLIETTTRLE